MRKHQQKQILELLETIREAQSAGSFADCQEGAVAAGEFIEQIKGEGTETVALLEEYCELIYKAHTGEIGIKPLNKQLVKIKNSVNHELKPDRIEMVFLSYKASMSDSIESIYLAARKDPNCDAFWIPIPYYSRNPDATWKEGPFEGAECYPDYIECTDRQEYDIEARHPDVIFTFAPYDDFNHLTQVHPDFFCGRLKNLTDCLVYVPYFVLGNNRPGEYATLEGCILADFVMLESEEVRERYIENYTKEFGKSMGDPKKKFVALGSPKYDKVLTTTRENTALPEKWYELIKGKKVILYNTAIGAILQGEEQYLEKLRHVLETFESRSDAVLWWRPHPLSDSTYEAMRPHLAARYKALVAQYKKDGWGIYDDTPGLQRAISWSNAYYGDKSSVIQLYHATGKPVMISNINALSHDTPLSIGRISVIGDDIWVTPVSFNALFKMSKKDWTLEFVGSFPGEDMYTTAPEWWHLLYGVPFEHGGIIYFPPLQAKEIATYSIDSALFEKIPYRLDIDTKDEIPAFENAVEFNDYVFFTPCKYPAILRLNTKTKETAYYSDWADALVKLTNAPQKHFFFSAPVAVENAIFFVTIETNVVVEFNMDTYKYTLHEIGDKDSCNYGICFDGLHFWVTKSTSVVKWHPQSGAIKEVAELFQGINNIKWGFFPGAYKSGYCWFLPLLSNRVCKIDTSTDTVFAVDELDSRIHYTHSDGDSIYAWVYSKKDEREMLAEYNCHTGEYSENIVRCSQETMTKIRHLLTQRFLDTSKEWDTLYHCYYYETNARSLNSFIDYVVLESNTPQERELKMRRKKKLSSANNNSDGTAGQAIYAFIKNTVLR